MNVRVVESPNPKVAGTIVPLMAGSADAECTWEKAVPVEREMRVAWARAEHCLLGSKEEKFPTTRAYTLESGFPLWKTKILEKPFEETWGIAYS